MSRLVGVLAISTPNLILPTAFSPAVFVYDGCVATCSGRLNRFSYSSSNVSVQVTFNGVAVNPGQGYDFAGEPSVVVGVSCGSLSVSYTFNIIYRICAVLA